MANIRTPHEREFSAISNLLLQDRKLSFGARGMMAYLLSKPNDWEARPIDIEREGGIGREARRKLMREAEEEGYLTFHTQRNKRGQIESWYDAHERPVSLEQRTKSWETGKSNKSPGTALPHPVSSPGTALPVPGQPTAGQPTPGEAGPLIKKERITTEEVKKDKKRKNCPADAGHTSSDSEEKITEWAEPYKAAFEEAHKQRYGLPYKYQFGRDLKALKDARKTYGDDELFDHDSWTRAVQNYFQSSRPKHSISELIDKYPIYLASPTDQFGHPLRITNGKNGNGKYVDAPQTGASGGKDSLGNGVHWRINRG
jgi:hypothetical protein